MADKTRLQDLMISSLKPFSEGGAGEKGLNPLANDLVKMLNFYDHLMDRSLGTMVIRYLHDRHLYINPATTEKMPIPDEKLEEIADAAIAELEQNPMYHHAYLIPKYVSHASMAIGLICTTGAGRITMKKLDEPTQYKGFKLDPIDKMQLFDFTLKGAACTAYQLIRSAQPHHLSADEHGMDRVNHMMRNLYDDVKAAMLMPFHNPYNRQFWTGYIVFDGIVNLPLHFIACGKPLSELEEATAMLGESIEDHTRDLLDGIEKHIPYLNKNKKEGVAGLLRTLSSGKGEYGAKLAGASRIAVDKALGTLDPQMRDRLMEAIRSGNSPLAAEVNKRREHWQKLHQHAMRGGQRSSASIIMGGIAEAAVAGIDLMGIYRSLGRHDLTYSAIDSAYRRLVNAPERQPSAPEGE